MMTKLGAIFDQAAAVFGSRERAACWMISPAYGLDNRRPIEVACTEGGRQLVETYLSQIDYGVYI